MERDAFGRILHRARPGAGAPPGPAPAAAASALPRSAAGRGRGGRRRESLSRVQASVAVGNLLRRRSVSRQYLESPTARPSTSRPAATSRGLGNQEAGVHHAAEELIDGGGAADDHQETVAELPQQQLDAPEQPHQLGSGGTTADNSTLPIPITQGARGRGIGKGGRHRSLLLQPTPPPQFNAAGRRRDGRTQQQHDDAVSKWILWKEEETNKVNALLTMNKQNNIPCPACTKPVKRSNLLNHMSSTKCKNRNAKWLKTFWTNSS